MNLRFTENNTSVLFPLSFVCHMYTSFQAWGYSSSFWFCYCTVVFAPVMRADGAGCQLLTGIVGNFNLSPSRTPFLSSPAHPSALPTCFSLGPQGHEKELPRTSSPLDRVLGRGSFAGEQPVFGELRAEAGGWAEGTHQVSVVPQHGGNQML